MAETLLGWIYATSLCFLVGGICQRALARLFGTATGAPPPFALVCFLGLGLLTTILGYLSLFMPLGAGVHAGVALAILALTLLDRAAVGAELSRRLPSLRNCPILERVLFLSGGVLVLLYAGMVPDAFDSGTYHIQAIRWSHEFPAVPGLGNLYGHLALNTHWFLACAFFDLPPLVPHSLHALNGLMLVWLLTFSGPGLAELLRGRGTARAWTRTLLLVAIYGQYLPHCAAPIPELPGTALLCLLFLAWTERGDASSEAPSPALAGIILVLCLFLPTLKLSFLGALFIIPLLLGDLSTEGWRRAGAVVAGLALFVVLPWVLRNLVLSGYPFYPSAVPDLLDVDWKIPRQDVEAMSKYIRTWARIHAPLIDSGLALSAVAWIPRWFGGLSPGGKAVIGTFALLPLAAAGVWAAAPQRVLAFCRKNWQEMALWLSAYGGAAWWFLSAPDTRFGFCYLLMLCLRLAHSALSRLRPLPRGAVRAAGIALAMLFVSVFSIQAAMRRASWGTALRPSPLPTAAVREASLRRGRAFLPVSGTALWDAPLPATLSIRPGLEWRGETAGEGFRLAAPSGPP